MKTVVNKVDTITNQFRVFDMELIAGDPEYVVEHVSVRYAILSQASFDIRVTSMNRTVVSSLISEKCTGIHDSIQSTTGWCKCFDRKTAASL